MQVIISLLRWLKFYYTEKPIAENGAVSSLEEHFRKSLGADYSRVFQSERSADRSRLAEDPVKAFREDLDITGYSGIVFTSS